MSGFCLGILTVAAASTESDSAAVLTGTVVRVYKSPQAAWFSIYASPSKFQKLTPVIVLLDAGARQIYVHMLESTGSIPAISVANVDGPGRQKPPAVPQLQVDLAEMPEPGDRCTLTVSYDPTGLVYAQTKLPEGIHKTNASSVSDGSEKAKPPASEPSAGRN